MSSRVADLRAAAAPSLLSVCAAVVVALVLPLALVERLPVAALASATALGLASCVAALRHPRLFWWATLAAAPLAIDWAAPRGGLHLTLPLEGMMLLGLSSLLVREGRRLIPSPAQAAHPMTLLVLAQVGWILIAAAFSADLRVSVKSAIVRIFYVACFYVLSLRLFEERPSHSARLVAIGVGVIPVTTLALARFAASGFDPKSVYESAQPFFQNRIDLCAALVLWALPAAAVWRRRSALGLSSVARAILSIALLLSGAALVGLRGRAALGALGVGLLAAWFSRRRPPRLVAAMLFLGAFAAALAVADLLVYRSEISRPGLRPAVSIVRSSLLAHPPFTDESFTERANRWSAAARMGFSRPLTGFGPGTFEGRYAPFQNPWETTRRSTWGGDEGDAHSEVMTAFAEQGLPGLSLLLAVLSSAFLTAARGARASAAGADLLPAAVAGSLAAFVVMNGPNSLLDVDKVAPLFWMACAAAVNFDLGSRPAATSRAGR